MTQSRTPRALALVGMPGAGKSLCAHHLEARGYYQYRFGQIVEDEVVRRGLAVNPANEQLVREELRLIEGMDVMAKRSLPRLQQALAARSCIVIDGLYSFSEYKTLRRDLGAELIVVAITCPRAVRYRRLMQRPIRPLTWEEAETRDYREIEFLEKGGPIAIADHTLYNDADPETLLAKLDEVVGQLGFEP